MVAIVFLICEFLRVTAKGDGLPGYEYVWRFRNRFVFPNAKRLDLEASSGIMIHVRGSIIAHDFDQHGSILQLHHAISNFRVSSGYMHWFFQMPAVVLQNRPIWLVGFKHNLDLRERSD